MLRVVGSIPAQNKYGLSLVNTIIAIVSLFVKISHQYSWTEFDEFWKKDRQDLQLKTTIPSLVKLEGEGMVGGWPKIQAEVRFYIKKKTKLWT